MKNLEKILTEQDESEYSSGVPRSETVSRETIPGETAPPETTRQQMDLEEVGSRHKELHSIPSQSAVPHDAPAQRVTQPQATPKVSQPYRDQIRRMIEGRRSRRHLAEIKLAEQQGISPDLITRSRTEDGLVIGELSTDSIFEFTIKILLFDLPLSQYHALAGQTLTVLNITHIEAEGGFECWPKGVGVVDSVQFTLKFSKDSEMDIKIPLPFLKDRNWVGVSDTYFRFERLSGDLEEYEDLVENIVDVFEKRWNANPNNPRW